MSLWWNFFFAFGLLLAASAQAAAPQPSAVTPELVAAAAKEGQIVLYTGMDARVAAELARVFEGKYSGIHVQIERTGGERLFQRLTQEYSSDIHACDVVESPDQSHFLLWKQQGILAQYLPEDVARWPASAHDPDGYHASNRASLVVIGYNTKLVKAEDAPKSFADLLDPRWKGKLVKAHPGYSGNIMTSTFMLSRLLGWSYFESLGQQKVMQVQSSTEPPKKLALGERPVMVDGTESSAFLELDRGSPLKLVYATEGTPIVPGSAGVMKDAPHPNAARLFVSFMFSPEGQKILVNFGHYRSFEPGIEEPASVVPLSKIKLLTADPAELLKVEDEIKKKYAEYFGT